jgi:hypothetical protein
MAVAGGGVGDRDQEQAADPCERLADRPGGGPSATSRPRRTACATSTSDSLLMFAATGPSRPGARRSSASASNSRVCTGRRPARPASSPCAACTPAAAGRDLAVTRPDRRGLTRHLTEPRSRYRQVTCIGVPPGWRWWIAGSAARGSGPGRQIAPVCLHPGARGQRPGRRLM